MGKTTIITDAVVFNSSLHTCASGHDGEEDKKHQDDWNSFKKHSQWESFRGAHSHYEAVGWVSP